MKPKKLHRNRFITQHLKSKPNEKREVILPLSKQRNWDDELFENLPKPQTKTPMNSRKPRTHKRTKQNLYYESMRFEAYKYLNTTL
uniref:Uncharacterized protein n=1 Tax=Solanum tuberosum TaxID=4113 RepID=M1CEI9_SOLTU